MSGYFGIFPDAQNKTHQTLQTQDTVPDFTCCGLGPALSYLGSCIAPILDPFYGQHQPTDTLLHDNGPHGLQDALPNMEHGVVHPPRYEDIYADMPGLEDGGGSQAIITDNPSLLDAVWEKRKESGVVHSFDLPLAETIVNHPQADVVPPDDKPPEIKESVNLEFKGERIIVQKKPTLWQKITKGFRDVMLSFSTHTGIAFMAPKAPSEKKESGGAEKAIHPAVKWLSETWELMKGIVTGKQVAGDMKPKPEDSEDIKAAKKIIERFEGGGIPDTLGDDIKDMSADAKKLVKDAVIHKVAQRVQEQAETIEYHAEYRVEASKDVTKDAEVKDLIKLLPAFTFKELSEGLCEELKHTMTDEFSIGIRGNEDNLKIDVLRSRAPPPYESTK